MGDIFDKVKPDDIFDLAEKYSDPFDQVEAEKGLEVSPEIEPSPKAQGQGESSGPNYQFEDWQGALDPLAHAPTLSEAKTGLKEAGRDIKEIGKGLAYGAMNAVEEAMDAAQEVGLTPPAYIYGEDEAEDMLSDIVAGDYSGLVGQQRGDHKPIQPESDIGKFTEVFTRFGVGFFPLLKGLKMAGGINALKGTVLAKHPRVMKFMADMIAGGAADYAVFDPEEGRLSDTLKEVGVSNAVTDYLASDPEDTKAEARFKNVLEGAGLGATIGAIFEMARASRNALRKQYGKQTDKVVRRMMQDAGISVPGDVKNTKEITKLVDEVNKINADPDSLRKAAIMLEPSPIQGERMRGAKMFEIEKQKADEVMKAQLRAFYERGRLVQEKSMVNHGNPIIIDPAGKVEPHNLTPAATVGPSVRDATRADLLKDVMTNDDISALRAHMDLPNWIAKDYDKFKPIYDRQLERTADKLNMQSKLFFGEDNVVAGAHKFIKLSGKRRDAVWNAMLEGDRKNIRWENDELVERFGLDNKGIEAYNELRDTMDWIWKDMIERARQSGVPENELRKIRNEMGRLKGYIPHNREGKYWMSVVDPSTGEEVFNTSVKSKRDAKKVLDWLKGQEEYKDLQLRSLKRIRKMDEAAYFHVTAESLNAIMSKVGRQQGLSDEIMKQFYDGVANTFKERGWMRHGIKRKGVRGFVGDVGPEGMEQFSSRQGQQAVMKYITGYSGFVNKIQASKDMIEHLRKIDPKTRLWRYSNDYIKNMLRNSDKVDNAVAKARSIAFLRYLGFSPKSAALNLTQNLVAAAPVMMKNGIKFAEGKIGKAMLDIVSHKKLNAVEARALDKAMRRGDTQAQYLKDLLGTNKGKLPKGWNKFMEAAGFMFGKIEELNRRSTFLASYRDFIKRGLTEDDAFARSIDIIKDSHYMYGQANAPKFLQESGIPSQLLRIPFTFRSYAWNYVRMLADLYKTDKRAMAKSLTYLLALGGTASLPFAVTVDELSQKFTGYSPLNEFRQWVRGLSGSDTVANMATYGLPAGLGFTLHGSMDVGVPTAVSDVFGIAVDIPQDVMRAYEFMRNGDWDKFAENIPFIPAGGANILSALRLSSEGVTSKTGAPIAMIDENGKYVQTELSDFEALLKGLGFQPVKLAVAWQAHEAHFSAQEHWRKKKERLRSKYREALRDRDKAKQNRLLAEARALNKKMPKWMTPIGANYMLQDWKLKPSVREMEGMRRFR